MFDKHTNKQKEKDGVWQNIEIWEDGLSIDEGPKQFVVERGAKFEGGFKTSLHFMYIYIYIYKYTIYILYIYYIYMYIYYIYIIYMHIYMHICKNSYLYIYILVNIYILVLLLVENGYVRFYLMSYVYRYIIRVFIFP